jgi:hypothetical protein
MGCLSNFDLMHFAETLLFLCVGAALLCYPIKHWHAALKARKLPLVDAIIIKNEILELHEPMAGYEEKLYQPLITFSAYVNGRKITSQALCPDREAYKFSNNLHAMASVHIYAVGNLIQARLLSTLEPALMLTSEIDRNRQHHYLAWGIFGILVWLARLGLIWLKYSAS